MAKLQTRAQVDLARAAEAVSALARQSDDFKKNYLSRVKQFPALVMTVGLAQALAFSAEKAGKENELGQAHRKVLEHVAAILGVPEALAAVRNAEAHEYMHMTRRVLAAWVYYRRLAVSLLDPEGRLAAQGEDDV